jgi:protein-tyrosine phosphatase
VRKVHFVCTANICRSPISETIFNALTKDNELPFRAESAGTAALQGRPMAPNAVAALEEIGIYPDDHRARQVSEAMIEASELVLAMSPRHAATLYRLHGRPSPKRIYVLPQYAIGASAGESVPDPYGHTMTTYRSSTRQLYDYIQHAVDRLGG